MLNLGYFKLSLIIVDNYDDVDQTTKTNVEAIDVDVGISLSSDVTA